MNEHTSNGGDCDARAMLADAIAAPGKVAELTAENERLRDAIQRAQKMLGTAGLDLPYRAGRAASILRAALEGKS